MPDRMSHRMPERMQNNMSEFVFQSMTEYMSDRMSVQMSNRIMSVGADHFKKVMFHWSARILQKSERSKRFSSLGSARDQRNSESTRFLFSMDWMMGTFTGKPHI